jgi:protein tyrosine phosphatase (PTP) superfamily phosphohydrolase (DUF442 family)
MRSFDSLKNFLQVSKNLATAGQPAIQELETLADDGYQVVINLGLHDTYYSLEDEPRCVEQLGMKYIYIPVDFKKPAKEDFIRFLNTMNLHRHKKVFVHCAENKRVSVFVGLYLVVTQQLSQVDGWNLIIEIWEPNLVWESYYYELLTQFYQIKEEVE